MAAADISIIPEFRETLVRLGLEKQFNITNNKIVNRRTKSFILFSGIKTSGGDQTGRLKSISGITTWVIEEGEDFTDEKIFDTIDDSIRTTSAQNRVIWIQNPTTKEHFIYKRWIAKTSRQINVKGFDVTVSDHPQVEHIHTTYHTAAKLGYLSRDWLHKAKAALQEVRESIELLKRTFVGTPEALAAALSEIKHTSWYYYNYIGGWLERAEGAIFTNWKEGAFDLSLPYCYGMDYGYYPDPLGLIKVAVDAKRKRTYWQEVLYSTFVDDVPEAFRQLGIHKNDLVVADTNEPRTTQILRSKKKGNGWNVVPAAKGAGSIATDIREIKQYTIVVTPESNNLKAELNNYAWNDSKASIPIDTFNHLIDPARYAFRRLVSPKGGGIRRVN